MAAARTLTEPGRLKNIARRAIALGLLPLLGACGTSLSSSEGIETQGLRCPTELTEHSIFDYGDDAVGSPTIAEALIRWQAGDETWNLRPEWSTLTAMDPDGNRVTFVNQDGWAQLRVEFTDSMGTGWLVDEYAACAELG